MRKNRDEFSAIRFRHGVGVRDDFD